MAVLLAIGAHPDDETMLAGGTLAWAVRAGLTVRILAVTRGEGGEVGEPPVTTQDRLGATREAELRCAAAALGAAGVTFLPFVDPLITYTGSDPAPPSALFRIDATPEEFERAVVGVIRAVRADVLLTHGSNGEYGHPQHVYTHDIVRQAFDSAGDATCYPEAGAPHTPAVLYTWAAYFPPGDNDWLKRLLNQDDAADWLLDLDDDLLDRKERAALCHLSQHALFTRRSQDSPIRAILQPRESLRRVAVHPMAGPDPLATLLATASLATRRDST
jgi:LmbE family N-acetylglucosaminyl deacetylase